MLLITKLRQVYWWVCEWKKTKIGEYLAKLYKQERGCLVPGQHTAERRLCTVHCLIGHRGMPNYNSWVLITLIINNFRRRSLLRFSLITLLSADAYVFRHKHRVANEIISNAKSFVIVYKLQRERSIIERWRHFYKRRGKSPQSGVIIGLRTIHLQVCNCIAYCTFACHRPLIFYAENVKHLSDIFSSVRL